MPATRAEFKDYCLRKLGYPVIDINVDDEQVEDRIDEALKFYQDYHSDGTIKMYLKHQITAEDKANRYIDIPQHIIGIVSVFNPATFLSSNGMFNVRYQFTLNDFWNFSSTSLVPYYMYMRRIEEIEEVMGVMPHLRYNRNMNRLYIDTDWNMLTVGNYIIIEAYQLLDPTTYTDVWNDRWLQKYATELIKRQWGTNLKKFSGMQMPGSITFNGQQIYDEADEAIRHLEEDIVNTYSIPASIMTG